MCFNKSYETYIKSGLLLITVLAIYLSKSNIRILNIFGLTFSVLGAIFLVVGSIDRLNPPEWNKDKQPPNLKRDWKHLFEKYYGLIPPGQKLTKEMDILDHIIAWQAKYASYPVLRLKAAEFGPWLLFTGFVLQICAALLA